MGRLREVGASGRSGWDDERLRAFVGDARVIARDQQAQLVDPPPAVRDRALPLAAEDDLPLEYLHPDDRGAMVRCWTRALQSPGVEVPLRCRLRAGDGWHDHEITLLNLLDDPAVGSVLVRLVDLGKSASDSAPPADDAGTAYYRPVWLLTLLDERGTIVRIEGMVDEILGRTRDEVVGTSIVEYLHDDDLAPSLLMWSELLAEPGSTRTIRQRVVQPDGSHVWIESTVMNRLDDPESPSIMSLAHDITDRRRTEERLRRDARTDPLTGVANRRHFDERLAEAIAGEPDVVVVFVDLDDFKTVNDAHGHVIGDELLTIVAQRLARAVRPDDLVARYGGDEFALVCPHVPPEAERDLLERLRQVLQHPATVGTVSWMPRASIGLVRHQHGESARDLMQRADTAMYAAKERRSPGTA